MQRVQHVTEILEWTKEVKDVTREGIQRANRQRVAHRFAAADPDHGRQCRVTDDADRREEVAVPFDAFQIRDEEIFVERVEIAFLAGFAVENLHRAHAGDVLVQRGVDDGLLDANLAVTAPELRLEEPEREEQYGDDGERHERQFPVQQKHQHRCG